MTKTTGNMYASFIKWKVVHGKALGCQLWFRTANVLLEWYKVIPWVYRANVFVEGNKYPWVWTYITGSNVFEVHIFDFDDDIYWKEIEVYLCYKIRDNKKFNSTDDLIKAIEDDTIVAKKEVKVLTFGTFDLVHDGHLYYLSNAKKYWDNLVTIVARDKSVQKFKGKSPLYSEEKRINDVENFQVSDIVELGHESDYFACIKRHNPKVICLGYDQKSANVWLQKYLDENNLTITIVILPPYRENELKSSILKIKK